MTHGWEISLILIMLFMVLVLIVVGPIFSIWSLNTLFNTEIEYSFKSWVAMTWIHTIIHGIRTSFKKTSTQQAN